MTHHYIEELPAYLSNPSPQWVDDNVDTFCTHDGDCVLVIRHRVLKMRVNAHVEISRQLICETPNDDGDDYIYLYYRDVSDHETLNTAMISYHTAMLASFNDYMARKLADAKEIVAYIEKVMMAVNNNQKDSTHV